MFKKFYLLFLVQSVFGANKTDFTRPKRPAWNERETRAPLERSAHFGERCPFSETMSTIAKNLLQMTDAQRPMLGDGVWPVCSEEEKRIIKNTPIQAILRAHNAFQDISFGNLDPENQIKRLLIEDCIKNAKAF